MVAVKFWACSKQSHKGRRGGRSLTGRSKEAGWRHTHRRGRRMDAQWSAIGRPIKNANIVYQFERQVCLPCTTIVPPLADQWRPLSDHCGDHCASIQRPRQNLSHHGNGSAFTLPSLRDLLCHYSSFGRSRKAQGSCCSSYTETELSGFRRPLSVLTMFMVAQRRHEGRSPVWRGLNLTGMDIASSRKHILMSPPYTILIGVIFCVFVTCGYSAVLSESHDVKAWYSDLKVPNTYFC